MVLKSSPQSTWQNLWQTYANNPHFKTNSTVIHHISHLFGHRLKNLKIIEFGAGSGTDIISLGQKGATVSALDFSPKSIFLIKKLAKKNSVTVTTYCQDCQKPNLSSNHFDLAFSVGLVEHFPDPLPVISSQLQIVRPSGYLIIDVPQKFNLYTLVKKIRMVNGTYPFGWETEYSYFDLCALATQLNTKIIAIYGRDSAFTLKLPSFLQPFYRRLFSLIENSFFAPFVCLNIGIILQKYPHVTTKN